MPLLVAIAPLASAVPPDVDPQDQQTPDDPSVSTDGRPSGIVNGRPVDRGDWKDAVGIQFFGENGYVGCTGTLIGPRVVLTAGHCVNGYPVTHALVGSTNWASDEGELIPVQDVYEYPNSQQTFDVGLLILDRAANPEPRAIGLDCIVKDYLKDGEKVRMVGFGVTDADGYDYNVRLNQGVTEILDRNCDENTIDGRFVGCQPSVSPGGELAAGGNGGPSVCYGDSGGPLYIETPRGDFVVGVASRLWLGSDFYTGSPCDDGAIWVRPDAVIEWIEDMAGRHEITYPVCNDPPEPTADPIVTEMDVPGDTTLTIVDPDGDPADALVEIVTSPAHGTATVDGHTILYTPAIGFVGADTLTVSVTDAGTDDRRSGDPLTVELEVEVEVTEAVARGLGGTCGCGSSSGGGSLALVALALTYRRGSRR